VNRFLYRFRAYPTPRQQRRLAREFGAARWVYNRGLETISRAWRERQERITWVDFSRQVTKLKQAEVPWLKEVSSYVPTQSLRKARPGEPCRQGPHEG
jgi:putative transposase